MRNCTSFPSPPPEKKEQEEKSIYKFKKKEKSRLYLFAVEKNKERKKDQSDPQLFKLGEGPSFFFSGDFPEGQRRGAGDFFPRNFSKTFVGFLQRPLTKLTNAKKNLLLACGASTKKTKN